MSDAIAEMVDQVRHLSSVVEQHKAAVKAAALKLQEDFCEYITDQTIDLDTRWKLWIDAPIELKIVGSWIEHMQFNDHEIDWYDAPVYHERYNTVVLTTVVTEFESLTTYGTSYYGVETDEDLEEAMKVFKEDILALNLHSFVLDW